MLDQIRSITLLADLQENMFRSGLGANHRRFGRGQNPIVRLPSGGLGLLPCEPQSAKNRVFANGLAKASKRPFAALQN
jgi:hypothetical protein